MLALQSTTVSTILPLLREAEPEFVRMRRESGVSLHQLLWSWEQQCQSQVFVGIEDGQIIGFIGARFADKPGTITLHPIYILPEHRRASVGSGLVRLLIEWARFREYRVIQCHAWGRNLAARRMFDKLGFVAIGERADDRVDGDSTIVYEYLISARANPCDAQTPSTAGCGLD